MRILLLILLILAPGWADDRAEISRLARTWGRITTFRQAGDYALVDWENRESGGQALVRKIDGQWILLTGGGGAMDGRDLWNHGVPETLIPKLYAGPVDLAEAKAAGPYWAWIWRDRTASDDLLESNTAFELTLMRNEIFASHGRVFKDPVLAAYFKSRPWYRPNPAYSDALLSERERKNAALISAYQTRAKKQF